MLPASVKIENELALLTPHLHSASDAVRRGLESSDGYSLSASPLNVLDGEVVTISYNVSSPCYGDWVALYLNNTASLETSTPVKYAFIDDEGYLATGRGSRRFQLINMRVAGGFLAGILTGGLSKASLMAVSSPAINVLGDLNAPSRPRAAPASADGSTLRISWTSGRDASSVPSLRWGIISASGPFPFNGSAGASSRVERTALCGPPANTTGWFDLGWTHSALVTLSDAGAARPARLWFEIGDSVSGWSLKGHDAGLAVPRSPGASNSYPATIAAFDDLGRGSFDDAFTWREYGTAARNTSRSLAKMLDADKDAFDHIWHVGDVSYSTGFLSVAEWYLHMIQEWSSRVLYCTGEANKLIGAMRRPPSALNILGAPPPFLTCPFSSLSRQGSVTTRSVNTGPRPPAPPWRTTIVCLTRTMLAANAASSRTT